MQIFPKNNCPLLLIPGVPGLSGANGDINPMISISFLLFEQLFNISSPIKPPPATGYTAKSLSDLPVYIIPLSVYTAQTRNKLNYF